MAVHRNQVHTNCESMLLVGALEGRGHHAKCAFCHHGMNKSEDRLGMLDETAHSILEHQMLGLRSLENQLRCFSDAISIKRLLDDRDKLVLNN